LLGLALSPGHFFTGGTTAIPHAALAGGGWLARALYDQILRRRAAGVTEAIRGEAPASLAQSGFVPGSLAAPSLTQQFVPPAVGSTAYSQ
jgi:hypothetical protein